MKSVGIIGGGPAGLTAAYRLAQTGVRVTLLEADPTYVGGLARTVVYKGFRFDIGGHRFFSKSKEVEDFWSEILGDDMLVRERSSRIYYRRKFFSYPLSAGEALAKLGLAQTALCVASYLKARLLPVRNPVSFEDWVTNRFGKHLFKIFFKTYTEKVWGMDCSLISADWAAQRIKGLSLSAAVRDALRAWVPKAWAKDNQVKTLLRSFRYPRLGPGMIWEACALKCKAMGGRVLMGRRVVSCRLNDSRKWLLTATSQSGEPHTVECDYVISSMALPELVSIVEPSFSSAALAAASQLRYRDFMLVAVILPERHALKDNWIYVHDPAVKVGRIQNFKAWSPDLVPDHDYCCYGMEYFCSKGDALWELSDRDLVALAARELQQTGLAQAADVVDGCVVRQLKAYPVYDRDYSVHVNTIKHEIESRFPNLVPVGRNGMHKYNNQDHSMMTAMLTVKNILSGRQDFDPWLVNEDAEYHEGGSSAASDGCSGLRRVPLPREAEAVNDIETPRAK